MKGTRRSLYQYIGDAYQKVAINGADEAILREAIEVLDAYCAGFVAAYPGSAVSDKVAEPLKVIRAALAEREAAAPQTEAVAPEQAPAPVLDREPAVESEQDAPVRSRPWKGLAIGGGVSLAASAAMVTLIGVGAARVKTLSTNYGDSCAANSDTATCIEVDRQGTVANRMQVAGIITAPLLLGAGIALLVVAMKRKSVGRQALTPLLGPRAVGVVWDLKF